jgi:hypothetical protein
MLAMTRPRRFEVSIDQGSTMQIHSQMLQPISVTEVPAKPSAGAFVFDQVKL